MNETIRTNKTNELQLILNNFINQLEKVLNICDLIRYNFARFRFQFKKNPNVAHLGSLAEMSIATLPLPLRRSRRGSG
jgi:hypothetical protein